MRFVILMLVAGSAMMVAGCSSGPRLKDLDCNPVLGRCSASIENERYDWFVVADSDCGVVTMENGKKLPFCGYKAYLGQGGEYGIVPGSCQVCVRVH